MRSYEVASARIVLDATGIYVKGAITPGTVVLNVTNNKARSITVQDPENRNKAVRRIVGQEAMRGVVLLGGDAQARATLAGFTR